MKLFLKKILKWPKLAWVASFVEGSEDIRVLHGPCVRLAGTGVLKLCDLEILIREHSTGLI